MSLVSKILYANVIIFTSITLAHATLLQPITAETDTTTWTNLSSLPGAKYKVLAGNPYKSEFFIIRLKFPANYTIAPHYHSVTEYDTVISGTWHLSLGNHFDSDTGIAMKAGTYVSIPAQATHYGWTKNETTIQISGIGPWRATYLNPLNNMRK